MYKAASQRAACTVFEARCLSPTRRLSGAVHPCPPRRSSQPAYSSTTPAPILCVAPTNRPAKSVPNQCQISGNQWQSVAQLMPPPFLKLGTPLVPPLARGGAWFAGSVVLVSQRTKVKKKRKAIGLWGELPCAMSPRPNEHHAIAVMTCSQRRANSNQSQITTISAKLHTLIKLNITHSEPN